MHRRRQGPIIGALVGLVVLAVVVALAAGGGSGDSSDSTDSGRTLVVALPEIPDTLNPTLSTQFSTAQLRQAVYDGLVRFDDKGNTLPGLATRWAVDESGTRWTFHLDPTARWQDGEPFTSKDVVFTTKLITNPKYPATDVSGFDQVKTIRADGPHKVNITTKAPSGSFLAYYGFSGILPEHIIGRIPPAKIRTTASVIRRPVGTGPYRVDEFVPGDHITLVANEDYFLGAPKVNRIVVRSIPDTSTAINLLRTGEVNLVPSLTPDQASSVEDVSGIEIVKSPRFAYQYVNLIQTGFFKDVRVRQALQMATDKARIIRTATEGNGVPQYADIAPSSPYYNPEVERYWPYDPDEAAAQLEQLGFEKDSSGTLVKDGKKFEITLYGQSGAGDVPGSSADIVQALKASWESLGVRVSIKMLDTATLTSPRGPLYDPDRFDTDEMNAVQYSFNLGGEPDNTFFWSSSQIPTKENPFGGNWVGYRNTEVDQLMREGLTTVDPDERKPIYQEIQSILARDVPVIWLYWAEELGATAEQLEGYKPNPFVLMFWNVHEWSYA